MFESRASLVIPHQVRKPWLKERDVVMADGRWPWEEVGKGRCLGSSSF